MLLRQKKVKSLLFSLLALVFLINSQLVYCAEQTATRQLNSNQIHSNHVIAKNNLITTAQFKQWFHAALSAKASYLNAPTIKQVLQLQNFTTNTIKQLSDINIVYILATNVNTKQQQIIIRGTSNVKNALQDISFRLIHDDITQIKIHQGFLESARAIYQDVLPQLKNDYKITTIGHSLGGALAVVLAMMLDTKGYTVDEVITFGQPKVTNFSGSLKFSHLNVNRLTTAKDIIPLLPPIDPIDLLKLDVSIFWHQGKEIILYGDNKYSVIRGMESLLRASHFFTAMPTEKNLSSHFLSAYIQRLKTMAQQAYEVKYKSNFSIFKTFVQ